jgi:hypothetical protein
MSHRYPNLQSFMDAWFHQDFDLSGDSVADIVQAYKRTASAQDVAALQADIHGFMQVQAANLAAQFELLFSPEADVAAFSGSTPALLLGEMR